MELYTNKEAKYITTKLKLDNRIKQLPKVETFIKLKDYEDNLNKITCKLINSRKTNIGKISRGNMFKTKEQTKNKLLEKHKK